MKQKIFWAGGGVVFAILACTTFAAESTKLPYAAGERFMVSTGYHTPPTHIKKDDYAIDFTQDGCEAYGKPVVAAFSGMAWVVEEIGYNGGYGTQLLISSGGGKIARYAHLIPGSIPFAPEDAIPQGTIIGEIGDTGFVEGSACVEHPGTHIHFAIDTENADGVFVARDPEPISGYDDITSGTWYRSDNVLAATKSNLASLVEVFDGLLRGGTSVADSHDQAVRALSVVASTTLGSEAPGGFSPEASALPTRGVNSPQLSIDQNMANSDAVSSQSPAPVLQTVSGGDSGPVMGGGSGGGGGNGSVSIPSGIIANATPPASASDDPSDDTVEVCD